MGGGMYMIITSKLKMDLQQRSFVPAIHAVQNDRYCRNLELTLYSGGEAWTIPETAAAMVRYSKSDGKGGEYDTLPDGTIGWSAAENVLTIALAPQVLTTAGPVNLAVTLLDGEKLLSTFCILLDVQAAVGENIGESEDYVHITGFLPAPASASVGQYFRISSVDDSGHVTGVEAVNLENLIETEEVSDEALLAEIYTLAREDYIHGVWHGTLDAGSDTPYYGEDVVGNKFSTRKFKTTKVPSISYFYNTTPLEFLFWNNGIFAGKETYTALSASWEVDFEFDEVAITFSWGWGGIDTSVVVKLIIANTLFKKVLVLGDSISADYYGTYPKWVTNLIEEHFLPATTNNSSIHATGFVARYTAEDEGAVNDFISRMEAVESKDAYDLVVVFGGINDFIQSIPMGESGGDYTVGFIPAVDYFFEYLVDNFTHARIVVLSPLRTYNVYANSAGHYQTEYADYIRQVAKNYCLPVLNLTEESGFCPFNDTFKNMWTLIPEGYDVTDGVHPNEEYQKKFLTPMIRNFLEQFG